MCDRQLGGTSVATIIIAFKHHSVRYSTSKGERHANGANSLEFKQRVVARASRRSWSGRAIGIALWQPGLSQAIDMARRYCQRVPERSPSWVVPGRAGPLAPG